MAYSTITLAELKTRSEDILDLDTNSDLNKLTVVIAANDFLAVYTPEERKAMRKDKLKTTVETAITEAGYDLSLITGLGDIVKVYQSQVAKGHQLFPISKANPHNGYRVEDGTLFLSNTADTTIFIQYFERIPKFSTTTLPDFATTIIPVLEGIEFGLENMVSSRYTRRDQSDPQAAVNYKNDALADIQNFFNTFKGSAFTSLHS